MATVLLLTFVIHLSLLVVGISGHQQISFNAPLDSPLSADPGAIVRPNRFTRLTVLTSRLIRLEWDQLGNFEDPHTFAVINRRFAVPDFSVDIRGHHLELTTEYLKLTFDIDSEASFNDDNLHIEFHHHHNKTVNWKPSMDAGDGNLLGTLRTLDGDSGGTELDCRKNHDHDQHCQMGLISRNGWALIDDYARPRLDTPSPSSADFPWIQDYKVPAPDKGSCGISARHTEDCGWWGITETECKRQGCCWHVVRFGPWCHKPSVGYQPSRDWYFLGHGLDFKAALSDFTLISGRVPMPPKYALGSWSSRYWAYSDVEFLDIVDSYERNRLPVDVMILDMDWHKTFYKKHEQGGDPDPAGQSHGWTGWSWDRHLFPDARAFLRKLKRRGLRCSVNLHPASGLLPHEDLFEEMARLLGYDPLTTDMIPFQSTNITFMKPFFDHVIGALENDGVDFFWLDWQQGESWESWTKIEGLNPTLWLNYLFWEHMSLVERDERPVNFHRWGGLGNHRYPIGFSGDTWPSWQTLESQIKFTVTASNVLFTYWSHDLGGHMDSCPPELYTRWIQFGAYSPIFRSHSTKTGTNVRYFWKYPRDNFDIMQEALQQRMCMLPYIYSMAKKTHDTGLGLLRPVYYEHPDIGEAYADLSSYFFGDLLFVRPIANSLSTDGLVEQKVWIPVGQWLELGTGKVFNGPSNETNHYTLDEMPVFMKSGSIFPEQRIDSSYTGVTSHFPRHINFRIFVGDQSTASFSLYEDDGLTRNYDSPDYSLETLISYDVLHEHAISISIKPRNGQFSGFDAKRSFSFDFPNRFLVESFSINGTPYECDDSKCTFSSQDVSAHLEIGEYELSESVLVHVKFAEFDHSSLNGIKVKRRRLLRVKDLLDNMSATYQEDYTYLLDAISTVQLMEYNPLQGHDYVQRFHALYDLAISQVMTLKLEFLCFLSYV